MDRRRFLAGGLAAAGLVAVGCAGDGDDASPASTTTGGARATPRPDAAARGRVAVVGAGLAGLTAGLDLRDAGWDVVVLEARTRVGGRVKTVRAPFSDGLHAEAGGESIDRDHRALQDMARRFDVALEERPADKLATGTGRFRGRRRGLAAMVAERGGRVGQDYERAFEELARLAEDEDVDPDAPHRADRADELDRRSLGSFLDGLDLVPEARFLVRTDYRGEYNAEPEDLSLLFALQQENAGEAEDDADVEALRVTGGNDRIPRAIAAELGDAVRLGRPVTRIDHAAGGARVTTGPARAGEPPIDAAHVVLAVPPPVLGRIDFVPGLPPAARSALARYRLGAAVKVISEFSDRFWAPNSGFTVTDLPFQIAWAPTDSYPSEQGMLTTFTTGDSARALGRLGAEARVAQVQRQLLTVYPEGAGLLSPRHHTEAWATSPWTGGGYGAPVPGTFVEAWPALRSPVGRLRFAGEHTEAVAGYMESAVRSGQRVAAAIGPPPR